MKHTNLLTQADRDMFDKIDRDCIAMHVPTPPKTFINLSVQDDHGNVIEEYNDRSHSWVRNAYNMLAMQIAGLDIARGDGYGAGKLGVTTQSGTVLKNTGGVILYPSTDSSSFWGYIVQPLSGDDGWGLVIGSGNTAESFNAYSLVTKILNGTTAGKMSYAAMNAHGFAYDAGTKKITTTMVRIFNNNSGASIDVNEVGIIVPCAVEGSANKEVMMARDLLATAVTVPNAGQLTVTYIIEMTFPA